MKDHMTIQDIKIGDKIKMRSPDSMIDFVLSHIVAIIPDPENKNEDYNMIVYRYWSKYRKRWFWKAFPYWHLADLNKWEYRL
jgi:hypothetical protein